MAPHPFLICIWRKSALADGERRNSEILGAEAQIEPAKCVYSLCEITSINSVFWGLLSWGSLTRIKRQEREDCYICFPLSVRLPQIVHRSCHAAWKKTQPAGISNGFLLLLLFFFPLNENKIPVSVNNTWQVSSTVSKLAKSLNNNAEQLYWCSQRKRDAAESRLWFLQPRRPSLVKLDKTESCTFFRRPRRPRRGIEW